MSLAAASSLRVFAYLPESELRRGTSELVTDSNSDSSRPYHLHHASEKWFPPTCTVAWPATEPHFRPTLLFSTESLVGLFDDLLDISDFLLPFGFNYPFYSLK